MRQFSSAGFDEMNVILLPKSPFSADRETVKSMQVCNRWRNSLYLHKLSTYSRRVSMALASDLYGKFFRSLPLSLGCSRMTREVVTHFTNRPLQFCFGVTCQLSTLFHYVTVQQYSLSTSQLVTSTECRLSCTF